MSALLLRTLAQTPAGTSYTLLYYAAVFFVLAIVAYLLGARGIAGMSAGIGRTLMFLFIVIAIVVVVFQFLPH